MRPTPRIQPRPQPGFRASSVRNFSRFSATVYRMGPTLEKVIDNSEKLANIAATIPNLMPGHDAAEKSATTPAAAPAPVPTVATTATPAVTETHIAAAAAANPTLPQHHHHSSMFSELDLMTLPSQPRPIYLVETVGGKERYFIAEIVIKQEIQLDEIGPDEHLLEDVINDDLHIHEDPKPAAV